MKKRLLLFLCIFTLLLSTAAQAEDMAAADTSVPAPSAEKADTLSPLCAHAKLRRALHGCGRLGVVSRRRRCAVRIRSD